MNPFKWFLRWLDRRIEKMAQEAMRPIEIDIARLGGDVSLLRSVTSETSDTVSSLVAHAISRAPS